MNRAGRHSNESRIDARSTKQSVHPTRESIYWISSRCFRGWVHQHKPIKKEGNSRYAIKQEWICSKAIRLTFGHEPFYSSQWHIRIKTQRPSLFVHPLPVSERTQPWDLFPWVRIHSSSTDKPDKEDALLVKTEARPTLAEKPGAKALYQRDWQAGLIERSHSTDLETMRPTRT